MTKNRLYLTLGIACVLGYAWIWYNLNHLTIVNSSEIGFCILKRTTTFPCPSCGSTRSVISLIKGDIIQSLKWNPIGIIIVLFLVICPLWILTDSITKKNSLHKAYIKFETHLKTKWIAVSAIVLILVNWGWNIYKGY